MLCHQVLQCSHCGDREGQFFLGFSRVDSSRHWMSPNPDLSPLNTPLGKGECGELKNRRITAGRLGIPVPNSKTWLSALTCGHLLSHTHEETSRTK